MPRELATFRVEREAQQVTCVRCGSLVEVGRVVFVRNRSGWIGDEEIQLTASFCSAFCEWQDFCEESGDAW